MNPASQRTDETFLRHALVLFYALICPYIDSTMTRRPPKITTFGHVRELKNVLANEDAFESLKDLEQDFSGAVAYVKAESATRDWPSKAKSATRALNEMGILESKSLSEEAIQVLQGLKKIVDELLDGGSKE